MSVLLTSSVFKLSFQIEGAFIQGLGWVALEELKWGDAAHKWIPPGCLYTCGPGSYKIPSMNDVPFKFNISLLKVYLLTSTNCCLNVSLSFYYVVMTISTIGIWLHMEKLNENEQRKVEGYLGIKKENRKTRLFAGVPVAFTGIIGILNAYTIQLMWDKRKDVFNIFMKHVEMIHMDYGRSETA